MNADRQPSTKPGPKLLGWVLAAVIVALVILPGRDTDIQVEQVQETGPGSSRPYSAVALETDGGVTLAKPAAISTASSIEFKDGRLSVAVDEMPLRQVMAEVSRQSGIAIQFIGEHPASTVNIRFSDSLLEPGLRRLLGTTNNIFVFAETDDGAIIDGQLAKVLILPAGESGEANNDIHEFSSIAADLSAQIQNLLPPSYAEPNAQISVNDNFSDQALNELREALGRHLRGSARVRCIQRQRGNIEHLNA